VVATDILHDIPHANLSSCLDARLPSTRLNPSHRIVAILPSIQLKKHCKYPSNVFFQANRTSENMGLAITITTSARSATRPVEKLHCSASSISLLV
jgi:hypothetical protein